MLTNTHVKGDVAGFDVFFGGVKINVRYSAIPVDKGIVHNGNAVSV